MLPPLPVQLLLTHRLPLPTLPALRLTLLPLPRMLLRLLQKRLLQRLLLPRHQSLNLELNAPGGVVPPGALARTDTSCQPRQLR